MSLDHEFLLVAADEHTPTDYLRLIKHPSAILIDDDVLGSVADLLDSIPTLNPATGQSGHGLNLCGPTAIMVDGASIAEEVFRRCTDRLGLTSERLAFDRLADHCSKVADSGGAHFVLHLGI